MMFVLQRKKDKSFYSQSCKWGEIEKARIFKRKGDLFLYLNHHSHNGLYDNEYFIDKKEQTWKSGRTKMEDINIISVKLIATGVQKKFMTNIKINNYLKN